MKMRPLASSEAQTRTCEAENSCGSACHKKVANHSQPSLKQRHRRRQPSIACQCNHPTFTPPCHLTFSLITMTITITITNHPWWDFVMVGKCSALMIILILMEIMTIIVLIANDSCEGDFEAIRANQQVVKDLPTSFSSNSALQSKIYFHSRYLHHHVQTTAIINR